MVIDDIFKHTYLYVLSLCKSLQRENIDLLEAINLAEVLTNEIETMKVHNIQRNQPSSSRGVHKNLVAGPSVILL